MRFARYVARGLQTIIRRQFHEDGGMGLSCLLVVVFLLLGISAFVKYLRAQVLLRNPLPRRLGLELLKPMREHHERGAFERCTSPRDAVWLAAEGLWLLELLRVSLEPQAAPPDSELSEVTGRRHMLQ